MVGILITRFSHFSFLIPFSFVNWDCVLGLDSAAPEAVKDLRIASPYLNVESGLHNYSCSQPIIS